MAKLIILYKHARHNLQTSVAFLCTRVKAPNKDDPKKLKGAMKYI